MTTKLLIDRELLEQVASEFEHDNDRYMLGRELRKVLAAPAPANPAGQWAVIANRIEEAFQFGFIAPVTYNDVLENDVAEAWEKEKVYLLRPLPAGPEVAP